MAAPLNPFHVFALFSISYFAGILSSMYIVLRVLAKLCEWRSSCGILEAVEAERLASSILPLLVLVMLPFIPVVLLVVIGVPVGQPALNFIVEGFLAGVGTVAVLLACAVVYAVVSEKRSSETVKVSEREARWTPV